MSMEIDNFYWAEGHGLDFRTLEHATSHSQSPSCSSSPAADRANGRETQKDKGLPLLRYSDWEEDRQYDESNPVCIHYDFHWKVSQRDKTRAKLITENKRACLMQVDGILQNRDKFPADKYTCDNTKITLSVPGTRGRGLKETLTDQNVNWEAIDTHLEGLGDLFEGVINESTAAKGAKKKKSRSEEQRLQLDLVKGLWDRVYKHHRCRRKHCKLGPHCMKDQFDKHHKIDYKNLKAIFQDIKANMKEGDNPDQVDVNVEIPAAIRKDIMQDPGDDTGDPAQMLQEYCTWILAQVHSDRWRKELQVATNYAILECLELDSIAKHPQVIVNAMVRARVKLGTALKFVGSVDRFRKRGNRM
ncbi:hypothetical protein V8C42DRAFT_356547 [Trichoderma barbatum]